MRSLAAAQIQGRIHPRGGVPGRVGAAMITSGGNLSVQFRLVSWPKMRWLPALAVAGALASAQFSDANQPAVAAGVPSGATLTILTGSADIASTAGANFAPATQGQLVSPGAVVRTSADGVAVLTFFDGSESQLASASQVEVREADYTPSPHIDLFQSQGVTVNRVIPLPPDGNFRTDTPDAIGLVRGTSYVVAVGSGTAAQRATSIVLLRDRDGHVGQVNVMPAATGLASQKPAVLAKAGAVAVTANLDTASGKLSAAALAQLEQAAHDLHDAGTAQSAATQAQQVLQTLAPAVQPAATAASPDAATVAVASVDQVQHESGPAATSTSTSSSSAGSTATAAAPNQAPAASTAAAGAGNSHAGNANASSASNGSSASATPGNNGNDNGNAASAGNGNAASASSGNSANAASGNATSANANGGNNGNAGNGNAASANNANAGNAASGTNGNGNGASSGNATSASSGNAGNAASGNPGNGNGASSGNAGNAASGNTGNGGGGASASNGNGGNGGNSSNAGGGGVSANNGGGSGNGSGNARTNRG